MWPDCIGDEAGQRTDTGISVLELIRALMKETDVVKRPSNIAISYSCTDIKSLNSLVLIVYIIRTPTIESVLHEKDKASGYSCKD